MKNRGLSFNGVFLKTVLTIILTSNTELNRLLAHVWKCFFSLYEFAIAPECAYLLRPAFCHFAIISFEQLIAQKVFRFAFLCAPSNTQESISWCSTFGEIGVVCQDGDLRFMLTSRIKQTGASNALPPGDFLFRKLFIIHLQTFGWTAAAWTCLLSKQRWALIQTFSNMLYFKTALCIRKSNFEGKYRILCNIN